MAFKKVSRQNSDYKDIESFFRDLSNNIESLYSHQADIIRSYEKIQSTEENVAIELPTGSGKTLIGLLIGEHKRKFSNYKVLYLCPTNQLVHQVAKMANEQYGIRAIPFTGSNRDYAPSDKANFNNKQALGVTSYSSLFNSNPYFEDLDLVILDDAHSSENYIASSWSLSVNRRLHKSTYLAIAELLAEYLEQYDVRRLLFDDIDPVDKGVVNIFPVHQFLEIKDKIYAVIEDSVKDEMDLKFNWKQIKDNLHACNLYFSWKEILIRPVVPPSLSNNSFAACKQRIFMSATLGNGGDLERITGIPKIYRIPMPKGWDKQGNGRRFFQFPSLSLNDSYLDSYLLRAISSTPRSVILVSNTNQVHEMEDLIKESNSTCSIFKTTDIEQSKEHFTESSNAVAIIANRFDGMDFPSDTCRLLIIRDIPYNSNIQERFLQSRMAASLIFYDRNRTRIIQAIGRCTRSPKDYSAVIVVGEKDLTDWLTYSDKNQLFHPELQAELQIGYENSVDIGEDESALESFEENLNLFLSRDEQWSEMESNIIELRDQLTQKEIPSIQNLVKSVSYEIKYAYEMWDRKFNKAVETCDKVLDCLDGDSDLKGYRTFWRYLKSGAAFSHYQFSSDESYLDISKDAYNKASEVSNAIKNQISNTIFQIEDNGEDETKIEYRFERVYHFLNELKINKKGRYKSHINRIRQDLEKTNLIEANQETLGKFLGFESKFDDDVQGAPDTYWVINPSVVIVFEDKYYEDSDKAITITDLRQLNAHPAWIKEYVSGLTEDVQIIPVMLSNSTIIEQEQSHLCQGNYYWNWNDYISWSKKRLQFFEELQGYYIPDEFRWKRLLQSKFDEEKLSEKNILSQLSTLDTLVF